MMKAFALLALFASCVSAVTIDLVLNAHNYPRADNGARALVWNQTTANVAQAYASACGGFKHSGTGGVGENIYASAPGHTPVFGDDVAAVKSWVGEYKNFNCAGNSCASGQVCGHWTQVIWGNTQAVGCGAAMCSQNSPWGTSYGGTWLFYVCQYWPPGNYNNQGPVAAAQCSSAVPCTPTTSCSAAGQTSGTLNDGCKTVTCGSGSTVATTAAVTTATTAQATTATTAQATTARPTTATTAQATTATTAAVTTATTAQATTTARPTTTATTAAVTTATTAQATTTARPTTTIAAATTAQATTTARPATTATTAQATTTARPTTGSAVTTSTTGGSTTGLTPGCHLSLSTSAPVNKKYTLTIRNSGTSTIKSVNLKFSGTITATTGLTRQSNGSYNVNTPPLPLAPGASTTTVTFTASTSAYVSNWGWGC